MTTNGVPVQPAEAIIDSTVEAILAGLPAGRGARPAAVFSCMAA